MKRNHTAINNLLLHINTHESQYLTGETRKLEPVILHMYHNYLLVSQQGAWKTFLKMQKNYFIHNMLVKLTCLWKHVTYAKEKNLNHSGTDLPPQDTY